MKTLLIVDDNELDAERVERGLKRLDAPVATHRAVDGIDALARLRGTEQDEPLDSACIVLLDINMPRMNGLEFLREIRSTPGLQSTPVFVLTTSDRPRDIAEAHALNVNGYIVKPSSRDEFLDVLSTLVAFWRVCKYETPTTSAVSPW